MWKSDIQVGRYYVGKTGFVRRVLYVDRRVVWEDAIGPGNCLLSVFASWARREVEEQHFGKYHTNVPA
jgi:hypothetical protein